MQHNVSLPAWSDAPELVKDGVLHVSIHVPAWGATTEFLAMRLPTMFQSTFPRGERHTANHGCLFWEMFQSTLPRGERPIPHATMSRPMGFNPRSRVGSDTNYGTVLYLSYVSIHAPAWGATSCSRCGSCLCHSFNPRSRVGSDRGDGVMRYDCVVSIHAPAWGATSCSRCGSCLCHSFNPRSRVGSDRCNCAEPTAR